MAYQPKSYRKFLAGAVTTALVATAVAPVAGAEAASVKFTDDDQLGSAKDAIYQAVELGLIKGYADGSYKPLNEINRGQVVKILARHVGDVDTTGVENFKDVVNHPDAELVEAALKVKAAGVFDGTKDGNLLPSNKISRQQMAKVLVNAFGLEKKEGQGTNVADLDKAFADFKEYIEIVAQNEVTVVENFNPLGNVSRAQFASFVVRAVEATTPVEVAPEVVSVSAINGTQLLVKFNKEVDKTTAETDSNYLIKKNGVTSPLTATTDYKTKLQEDGKSVIITLASPIPNDETALFTVTVEDILLKGSLTEKFPVFTSTVTVSDKVAPEVTSVSAKTAGTEADTLTVNFSEPVAQPTVKVNGVTKSIVLAADGLSGTVSNLSLETGKTHTVEFVNLTDLSNNVTASASKSFTVTVDTAAPTYTVSTVSDKRIKLTFNKKMDVDSVLAGVVLKKEDLNDLTKDTHYKVTESQIAGEKGKVFNVDLIGGGFDPYASKSSYEFTLMTNAYVKDSLGNKAAATSRTVKLTKDVVKPTLTSVQYLKNSAGQVTTLLLKYDEVLASAPAAITGLTAKNVTTGSPVNILGSAPLASLLDDGQTVRIDIDTSTADEIKSGKLEIEVAPGYVTDIAQTPNNSNAYKATVDFGAGSSASLKVKKVDGVATNEFKVTFDGQVTYASATNPANYTINGVVLPADTVFTFDTDKKDNVTIKLPLEFVKADDAGAVLRVQNVETAAGTKVAVNQNIIAVEDNAGPIILKNKSSINSNGTLTLGFDEKVATIASGLTSADVLGDLRLFLNGEEVTVSTTATGGADTVVVTDGSGADAGKYVLTFNTTFVSNAASSETAADGDYIEYFDVDGNGSYSATVDILIKKATNVTNDQIAAYTTSSTGVLNLTKVANITVGTKDATAKIADVKGNKVLKKQSVVIK